MLVYGTLDQAPIRIDPRRMIAGKRVVEGFYLGHWAAARSKVKMVLLFREIADLIREGVLATETGPRVPARGDRRGRPRGRGGRPRGKVLLRIGDQADDARAAT